MYRALLFMLPAMFQERDRVPTTVGKAVALLADDSQCNSQYYTTSTRMKS